MLQPFLDDVRDAENEHGGVGTVSSKRGAPASRLDRIGNLLRACSSKPLAADDELQPRDVADSLRPALAALRDARSFLGAPPVPLAIRLEHSRQECGEGPLSGRVLHGMVSGLIGERGRPQPRSSYATSQHTSE